MFLKKSTASQEVLLGPFLDDTDGKTAETALSIANTDIKIWKSGATTEANKNSGGATHIAAGRYYVVLDATDTNTVGMLEINIAVSGALPVQKRLYVLEEAVYDNMFGADAAGPLTTLGTNAPSNWINAGAIAASALNDKGNWNIGKTGYALTQAFPANFAALGINSSGHVSRVVLVDTTTTNTDMRGTDSALLASSYTAAPTASQNATQVRTELATELGRIDATISSRSTFAGGAVDSVTGAVGSVTSPVTVGTNNDKTGYALTQSFPSNFASLGINSSGHVSRVVLVDTTTTNTDMIETASITGVADDGSTTTSIVIKSIAITSITAADQLKGRIVIFDKDTTTAALRGQGAPIEGGSTTALIISAENALTTAPAEDDTFTIY
jgi:hypothetical protein